jgi:nitroreductase
MMRKIISTQLSNQVVKSEEESVRYSEYKINPLLLNRWSPRSMTGDEELSNEELMPIFEAARWAPSAFNTQPWRFITQRNTVREEVWNRFFNLLADGNRIHYAAPRE